jgi:hypothetical protein
MRALDAGRAGGRGGGTPPWIHRACKRRVGARWRQARPNDGCQPACAWRCEGRGLLQAVLGGAADKVVLGGASAVGLVRPCRQGGEGGRDVSSGSQQPLHGSCPRTQHPLCSCEELPHPRARAEAGRGSPGDLVEEGVRSMGSGGIGGIGIARRSGGGGAEPPCSGCGCAEALGLKKEEA